MQLRNGKEESGGIEGLPLQLMIIILVATMGAAILVGWMGNIEAPHSIGDVDVDPDSVEAGADGSIVEAVTITVTDQDGNLLEGATVVLEGLNVRISGDDGYETAYLVTDSEGKVTFENLNVRQSGSASVGFIDVLVTKSGYGESSDCRITVVF